MVPTGPTEIMFATNRFNRVSVALPVEKNSGMDRYGPTNLAATGTWRHRPFRDGVKKGHDPNVRGGGQSFVALAENPLIREPEAL
jgi:hypothetical protein